MMKKILINIFFIMLLVAKGQSLETSTSQDNKLKIVTTIFPLYDMAANIGGKNVSASLLLPPGTEAHSFEPKPSDIERISKADIFIYTGPFMEPWADDLLKGVRSKNLLALEAGKNAKTISASAPKQQRSGRIDPHIWLNFDNAKTMAEAIALAMMAKDPVNSGFYKSSLTDYKTKLTALDLEYKKGLADCRTRNLVYGGHYALGYLSAAYKLNYLAAQGFSPDSEPTAKELATLIEQIRKDKLIYIFAEELSSPKVAEILASETGAGILKLSSAHTLSKKQMQAGLSFFDILKKDLETIRLGLQCK